MVVLPGYELTKNCVFSSRSAHLLALGAENFISANLTPVQQLNAIKSEGAITVAAHPVDTGVQERQTYRLWNMREELNGLVDAWEVASGSVLFKDVQDSGLPMIANSDMHRLRQVQSWKTVLDCERHPEAILEAIKKQELEFRFFSYNPNDYINTLKSSPFLMLAAGT